MKDLLNLLKEKYDYDDNLLNFLGVIIPTMIEYFGEEYKDHIISSFIETPIIITKKSVGDEIGDDDISLLLAGGAYCFEIVIENNKPKISGKVVMPSSVIKPFSFENLKNVSSLVHELCHMVKSGLTISADENLIAHHIGLVQTKGVIENNDYSEISNNNARSLEEALNSIDEVMIMNRLYQNYELTSNYRRLVSYIWPMVDGNVEFVKKIRQSQFAGNDNWQEYLGNDTSKKLIELCARHYDLVVTRIFEVINNETLQQEGDNIEEELVDIINLIQEKSTKGHSK